MAKQAKTRKPARRAAVARKGADTAAAGVRAAPRKRGKSSHGDLSCGEPARVDTYSDGGRLALVSFSCCEETRHAIFAGVGKPGKIPRRCGQEHLLPLQTRLERDKLEEYCIMVWGLNEEQATRLSASVPEQVGFTPDARARSK